MKYVLILSLLPVAAFAQMPSLEDCPTNAIATELVSQGLQQGQTNIEPAHPLCEPYMMGYEQGLMQKTALDINLGRVEE